MRIAIQAILLLVTFISIATAGPRVTGNGGDVVTWFNSDGSIDSVELLDHYEERVVRRNKILLDPAHTVAANFSQLVSLLDPYNRKLMLAEFPTFKKEALFLRGQKLVDIPDSQHISLPDSTQLQQIVIQSEPDRVRPERYIVDEDLWDELQNDGRAGLTAHELFLKKHISAHGTDINSIPVRYLVGVLASGQYGRLSNADKVATLLEVGFEYFEVQNLLVDIESVKSAAGSHSHIGKVVLPLRGRLKLSDSVSLNLQSVNEDSRAEVEFDDDFRKVKKVTVDLKYLKSNPVSQVNGIKLSLPKSGQVTLTLSDTGQISNFEVAEIDGLAPKDLFSIQNFGQSYLVRKISMLSRGQVVFETATNYGESISPISKRRDFDEEYSWKFFNDGRSIRTIYTRTELKGALVKPDMDQLRVPAVELEYGADGSLLRITNLSPTHRQPNNVVVDYLELTIPYFDNKNIKFGQRSTLLINLDNSVAATNLTSPTLWRSEFQLKLSLGESMTFNQSRYVNGGVPRGGLDQFGKVPVVNFVQHLTDYSNFVAIWGTSNPLVFHHNGLLKEATISLLKNARGDTVPVRFTNTKGKTVLVSASGTRVKLDEKGRLISMRLVNECDFVLGTE